jgi:predicted NAD-dependent protein-ADP-ribosyltransferase YbiA (DUF1768 family)
MPYQNDPEAVADDLFDVIPKFSELMPKINELKDPTAIANLPALKQKYEQDEAAALERMRRPNPLLNDNWGKSKMEIVAEAIKAKAEEERKQKLMKVLDEYQEEATVKRALKAAQEARENAVKRLIESGVN